MRKSACANWNAIAHWGRPNGAGSRLRWSGWACRHVPITAYCGWRAPLPTWMAAPPCWSASIWPRHCNIGGSRARVGSAASGRCLDAQAGAWFDGALIFPRNAMTIELGLMLAGMLMIGFLAQWLAWRVRLPAILFLLLAGILLGPATGLFRPDAMLGDMLFPLVSLAVALILFEGSMTLRFHELPDIGRAVRGLVSYGAIAALLLLALAARLIAGL